MPTIGEVYNPLIDAALSNAPDGNSMLRAVGEQIYTANPNQCANLDAGIQAARSNLDYYCQYFSEETAQVVKKYYGLGAGFRDLAGNKWEGV